MCEHRRVLGVSCGEYRRHGAFAEFVAVPQRIRASAGEYPECLALIASGKINVTAFISATPPLAEGAQWFARLHAGEPGLMKVLLKP